VIDTATVVETVSRLESGVGRLHRWECLPSGDAPGRSASICDTTQEKIELRHQPMHMIGRQAIAFVLNESRFEFSLAPMIAWKSKLRPIVISEKRRPTAMSGRPQKFERFRVS
jgi:hypothetical protein